MGLTEILDHLEAQISDGHNQLLLAGLQSAQMQDKTDRIVIQKNVDLKIQAAETFGVHINVIGYTMRKDLVTVCSLACVVDAINIRIELLLEKRDKNPVEHHAKFNKRFLFVNQCE